MGNVDGGLVGDILGSRKEGTDRTGQRAPTYELAEALLRHLAADGRRGEVRITVSLDEAAWAKYRSEVQRPMRAQPSVVVVPVAGVGVMEFRRAGPAGEDVARGMSEAQIRTLARAVGGGSPQCDAVVRFDSDDGRRCDLPAVTGSRWCPRHETDRDLLPSGATWSESGRSAAPQRLLELAVLDGRIPLPPGARLVRAEGEDRPSAVMGLPLLEPVYLETE